MDAFDLAVDKAAPTAIQYEVPVGVTVVASGIFKHSVGVTLTTKGRRLQTQPKEDAEKCAASVIVGCGYTVTDILGIACHLWSAWKCLDLPTCLRVQMAAQKPFTMPMLRHFVVLWD